MKTIQCSIILCACIFLSACVSRKVTDEDSYFRELENNSQIVLRSDGKIEFSWATKKHSRCAGELRCTFEYELLEDGYIKVNVLSSWVIHYHLKFNSNGDIEWTYDNGHVFKYAKEVNR